MVDARSCTRVRRRMANSEHVELLRRGVKVWNASRPDRPDLSNAKLVGWSLRSAYLGRANLSAAVLSSANLVDADLIDTILVGTDLSGAKLVRANLSGANLGKANLF